MSGRSAYVRKAVKKKENEGEYPRSTSRASEDHRQAGHSNTPSLRFTDFAEDDKLAYARVKVPVVPDLSIVGSGISKSAGRAKFDNMTENVRKGMFSFRKKKPAMDPEVVEKYTPVEATFSPVEISTTPAVPSALQDSTPNLVLESPTDRQEALSPGSLPQAPAVQQRNVEMEGRTFRPPPTLPPIAKLPPVPSANRLKCWRGGGRPPQSWSKLRKDPELWDPVGDTLVYLDHRNRDKSRLSPCFRISSRVLEAIDSRFFSELLQEGCIVERKNSVTHSYRETSPSSAHDLSQQREQQNRQAQLLAFPSPPQSETSWYAHDPDGTISYALYFPAPINMTKTGAYRFHATTRNVFALLYQASLVGETLCQALTDLTIRLSTYIPELDCASFMREYVLVRQLDDVRGSAADAVSMLVWSESKAIRWYEGWRESFVHCVGMYDELEKTPEWRGVSPISRAMVERANLEHELRLQEVETQLRDFDFAHNWPRVVGSTTPDQGCFERFRLLLVRFYQQANRDWPPAPPQGGSSWLTRRMLQTLQTDFGALYDYLVDRNTRWDQDSDPSIAHSTFVKQSQTGETETTSIDTADMLSTFDSQHQYPPVPHPYPLTPTIDNSLSRLPAERQWKATALAYTEATNIYVLVDFDPNKLVDAFVRFEKNDRVAALDPQAARLGRWILIYSVLQALASISADVPGLRWTENVSYHLNCNLRGTPPWKPFITDETPTHNLSYCWTAPQRWREQAEEGEGDTDQDVTKNSSLSPSLSGGFESRVSHRSSLASSAPSISSDADIFAREGRRHIETNPTSRGPKHEYKAVTAQPTIAEEKDFKQEFNVEDTYGSEMLIRDFDELDF